MTITEFVCAAVAVGCFTSWCVVLLTKWGVLEWMHVQGEARWGCVGRLLGQMAECHYCLNWWLAWLTVVPVSVLTCCWWLLLVPFFSTTIGRLLSN